MDIEYSTRGLMTAFFRQGKAFMLIALFIFGGGLAYVFLTSPIYESRGSVVVKFGRDARPGGMTDEQTAYATETDSNSRQEIIRSYIKIIFSQEMLLRLVEEFGPYRLYPQLEKELPPDVPPAQAAVELLMDKDLRVSNDETHVIDIAVRNSNPDVATVFAARVMNAFIRRRTEIYNAPQTDFLETQIAEAQSKLESSQDALQDFKREAGISAIDEELSQLLREKAELSTAAFAAIKESQARLAELEAQAAEMRATYRSESPMLRRMLDIVAVARADLQNQQNDLLMLNGSGSSLGTRMANVDKRLAYLEGQRGRYNDLQQQVDIDKKNYLYYLQRGEEARINTLLNRHNITRIAVVDEPVTPLEPIHPRKTLFLAITLLASLVGGIGVALSREMMDDRLSNPDQVRALLGVPVLATFEKETAK